MRIRFLLWGPMRVAAGRAVIEIDLPEGGLLQDALKRLYATHSVLAPHRSSARTAIGNDYVNGNPVLTDGTEVALIPPVQGG